MSVEFNYPSSAVNIGVTKPCERMSNVAANTDTVGPDNPCKRVLIKAHKDNTGTVCVNFSEVATGASFYPLYASETISVPLANTNLIHLAFTVANEVANVLFSN
jgi:hypothetical protein